MNQAIAENSHSTLHSLHIPRAILNLSSSPHGSNSSQSREFSSNLIHHKIGKLGKTSKISHDDIVKDWCDRNFENTITGDVDSKISSHNRIHQKYFVHKERKANLTATQSSSSSFSNHSNHSINSLLLSVKNLENFNNRYSDQINSNKIYNTSDNVYRKQMLENIKNILAIDNMETRHNQSSNKKDADQISTSSSATYTNFTVITFNGFDKKKHKKTRAICRRRHQVTILIICMTILLFIGISSAVCMLEMRYQKMPR